jgi:RNA recognition motif-containing protein
MTTINSNNGDGQTSPFHDTNGQKPEDDRKLFVGGLTWDTTSEDLREYFSNFGHILDCSIKHDPTTGRSRGFAFLVFDRQEIVDKILSQNVHFVKGRKVDPKPAHRRLAVTNNNHNNHLSSSSSSNSISNNNRKVFIGGLDPNFPDVQLREYFSQFGTIDEIDLPYDKEKNERRPFCFISFQNEHSAQEVLRLQRHTIGDITVDVKRAKPKTLNNQQQQQQMYDPYGQQSVYANYGTGVPSYGVNAYSAADPYAAWSGYPYNQQGNPGAYSYGGSDSAVIPNAASSSYPQYSQHQSNSQYSYGASNANEYYSHYGYGAPHPTSSVYADPNVYGGGVYDYNSYYTSGGAGVSGSAVDNITGQQESNSPTDANNYDHDNRYGKAKTSIVSSPNYHTYPIT